MRVPINDCDAGQVRVSNTLFPVTRSCANGCQMEIAFMCSLLARCYTA